jgi:hypothetical protein
MGTLFIFHVLGTLQSPIALTIVKVIVCKRRMTSEFKHDNTVFQFTSEYKKAPLVGGPFVSYIKSILQTKPPISDTRNNRNQKSNQRRLFVT